MTPNSPLNGWGEEPPSTSTDSAVPPPSSPFITTSDVMNHLNKHLSNLSLPPSSTDATGTNNPEQQQQVPKFELQKRLPDGGTIPATPDEVAAADFKTKLEQSAKFVAQLATPDDRQGWAEQQRLLGNSYFGLGDYKSAMDVYLTCLVVKESTSDFVNRTLIPILNNLAQCTLQLGMHRKTVLFCDIALHEIQNVDKGGGSLEPNDKNDNNNNKKAGMVDVTAAATAGVVKVDKLAICKIYYKLAKAQRLSGNYSEARNALNFSLASLEEKLEEIEMSRGTPSSTTTTTEVEFKSALLIPYQQSIQKEYRHLDLAEKEARRNHQRQKRAMQNVLSNSSNNPARTTSSATSGTVTNFIGDSLHSDDNEQMSDPTRTEARKFSTLRARKAPTTTTTTSKLSTVPPSSSTTSNRSKLVHSNNSPTSRLSTYSQYYWSMIERVTSFLLTALASDGEDVDKRESHQSD